MTCKLSYSYWEECLHIYILNVSYLQFLQACGASNLQRSSAGVSLWCLWAWREWWLLCLFLDDLVSVFGMSKYGHKADTAPESRAFYSNGPGVACEFVCMARDHCHIFKTSLTRIQPPYVLPNSITSQMSFQRFRNPKIWRKPMETKNSYPKIQKLAYQVRRGNYGNYGNSESPCTWIYFRLGQLQWPTTMYSVLPVSGFRESWKPSKLPRNW